LTDELGFIRRNTIIWQKNNVMPSSVKDRFTTDFEYLYFFTKSGKYYFEQQFEPHLTHENRPDAIIRNREYGYNSKLNAIGKKSYSLRAKRCGNKNPDYYSPNGRNKRCVWKINTKPFKDAHFATYPELLCDVPIKAGCPQGGVVLDPFMGSGTTGVVSAKLGRSFIGVELNPEYAKMAEKRIEKITSQKALF
jgi:site-specific DNA-methyltransferase (adenine-specific)